MCRCIKFGLWLNSDRYFATTDGYSKEVAMAKSVYKIDTRYIWYWKWWCQFTPEEIQSTL